MTNDKHNGSTEPGPALPKLFHDVGLAWVMLVCGAIGLLASFMLTVESINSLTDPETELLCDFSVFVTCQPAMSSSAGAILGFPNIILGLICFTIMVTSGVVLMTGASLPRWYWVCIQLGLIGAAALISYLQWYSSFELMALCLWCMIIWTATIPLVSLVTIGNLARGHLGKGAIGVGRALASWAWVVIVVWFLAVIGLVFAGMGDLIILSMI